MRKLLSLVLVSLLLIAALPLSLPMQNSRAETAFTAKVRGGALHLREKPDQASRSLGRYRSGTRVELLADGEEFIRVKTPDGQEGYMMKKFLLIEGGLPPMEVITPTPAPTPDPTRENALRRGIDPNKPMLALTFDDGPRPESLGVLEALDKYGAKATFFILGQNIAGNEEILKKIAASGHQLGSHSWSHPNLTRLSESAVRSQIQRTMDKIYELTGQTVTMMRPPFGASNRTSRRPLADMGLPLILWSADSLDWETRSVDKTVQAIRKGAKNGAIILCHDVVASTGKAIDTILPELIDKGFQLVTVAEMMSFREEPLKPGWEYSHLDINKIEPGLTPLPPSPTPGPEGETATP